MKTQHLTRPLTDHLPPAKHRARLGLFSPGLPAALGGYSLYRDEPRARGVISGPSWLNKQNVNMGFAPSFSPLGWLPWAGGGGEPPVVLKTTSWPWAGTFTPARRPPSCSRAHYNPRAMTLEVEATHLGQRGKMPTGMPPTSVRPPCSRQAQKCENYINRSLPTSTPCNVMFTYHQDPGLPLGTAYFHLIALSERRMARRDLLFRAWLFKRRTGVDRNVLKVAMSSGSSLLEEVHLCLTTAGGVSWHWILSPHSTSFIKELLVLVIKAKTEKVKNLPSEFAILMILSILLIALF